MTCSPQDSPGLSLQLLDFVVDRLEVGIFAVDASMNIVLWNRFMASHSGRLGTEVIGRNLFECFPELPVKWLEKKINSVFVLKNYAFTSWEQRPYLFRFNHNRPITGGIEAMQQSCTFLPVKDEADNVGHVCVTLFDYTDTALYQAKLTQAIAELDRDKEVQDKLIAELEVAQEALQQLASFDALTGLANRRTFDKNLSTEWRRASRESQPLSLLMIDVDYFKRFNDAYGHQMGDACLQFVATAISAADLRETDTAARYGGEEFSVILPGTTLDGARVVGERIRECVQGLEVPHKQSEVSSIVSISVGAATMIPTSRRGPEQLIAVADDALYQAKRAGRNRVVAVNGDADADVVPAATTA